jgi:hypothetical protein
LYVSNTEWEVKKGLQIYNIIQSYVKWCHK